VGTSAAVLALVVATDPEGTPRAPLSAGPTRVVGFNTVEDLSWAAGAFHARIAFGAPEVSRASLEVLLGSEDAPVAEHTHPGSWELLAALTAAGTLVLPSSTTVDGGAPGEERAVSDGDVVQVPPAVRHRWAPVGSRPLVAVQVYAPAGPEQRFRALAGAAR
jgi:mannose-6-phosphate isomerase-like protein (cupin superfamily)